MSYVFVSYSRWDRRSTSLIDRVLNGLRYANVPLWLAPDSVPTGVDWHGAIDQAIEGAAAHLVFVSKRYPRAHGMQSEIEKMKGHDIPQIVLLLDVQAVDVLPSDLTSVNAVSLYSVTTEQDFTAAILEILLALPPAVRGDQQAIAELETTAEEAASAVQNTSDAPIIKPKSMGYVFISYAEEDTTFVVRLRDFLRARGYGYWDYQENERDYNALLDTELENVIQNATAVISVVSPAWSASKWTKREYLYAEDIGLPIFVVRIAKTDPSIILAGVTYIDFVREEAAGFTRLDGELRRKGLI